MMKKRKAKRSLSTHNRSEHQQNTMANNEVSNEQASVKMVSNSTKVSLQCDLCDFKTTLLRRSKARQRWYNHQYSHIVNVDRFQYSVCEGNKMEEDKRPSLRRSVSRLMMDLTGSSLPDMNHGWPTTS